MRGLGVEASSYSYEKYSLNSVFPWYQKCDSSFKIGVASFIAGALKSDKTRSHQ